MNYLGYIGFYLSMMALGLSMATPPGPVNAMISVVSVQSKLKGTAVGAGAMTADLIFFFIVLLMRGFIPTEFIKFLYLIGGSYTAFLGFLTLRAKMNLNVRTRGSYLIGLSMGITNPYQIAWWVSFGIAMLDKFGIQSGIGFFSGIILWIITYPYLIEKAGKSSKKVEKLIKITSAIVLFLIGIYMITLFIFSV